MAIYKQVWYDRYNGMVLFYLLLPSPLLSFSVISFTVLSFDNFLQKYFYSVLVVQINLNLKNRKCWKRKKRKKLAGFVMTYLKKRKFLVEIFSRHSERDLSSLVPDSFKFLIFNSRITNHAIVRLRRIKKRTRKIVTSSTWNLMVNFWI